MLKAISSGKYVIASNGFTDGPAQALREFLLRHRARRLVTVFHPLNRKEPSRHVVAHYEHGVLVKETSLRVPSLPPLTYPIDLLIPSRIPKVDVWFGFNNLCCLRGIFQRRRGRADKVVYWCVDFVPERFGEGLLTRTYDAVDSYCCRKADMRFELAAAGLAGRQERHGLASNELAPAHLVPMGAWLDRAPRASSENLSRRTIVYLGHLVPRQGVRLFLEALELLARDGRTVPAEIIGGGPLLEDLKADAVRRGVASHTLFHGFVPDHRQVETILARAAAAVAPYEDTPMSFTRFADPGKLKAYLAAGLPIVLTDVPPNARELEAFGGAAVVPATAEGIALGILEVLGDGASWQRRSSAATEYARRFDWNTVLGEALACVGYAEAES